MILPLLYRLNSMLHTSNDPCKRATLMEVIDIIRNILREDDAPD